MRFSQRRSKPKLACVAVLGALLGALFFVLGSAPGWASQRNAILIGNQNYNAKVGKLHNPHADIARIGKALEELNFAPPIILKDKSRDETVRAVIEYASELAKAGPDAVGFLYYAGHGLAVNEINYILPSNIADTDPITVESAGIRLAELIRILVEKAPNAAHFLVIDACRNELAGQRGAISLVPQRKQPGVYIVYSTSPGYSASDGNQDGSPFAASLEVEMLRPGFHHHDMFFNVREKVAERTREAQIPWFEDGLRSRIYFAARDTAVLDRTPAEQPALRAQNWKMTLGFPSSADPLGTQAVAFRQELKRITEGVLDVTTFEPGQIVPTSRMLEALGDGIVPLGWSTPLLWRDRSPIIDFFFSGAYSHGLTPTQFVEWIRREGWDHLNLFYRKYKVRSVPCGLSASVPGTWHSRPVKSIDDIKGLKIRTTGLEAKIYQSLGASPVTIAGGEIYTALQMGAIDAAETKYPNADLAMRFPEVLEYYYESSPEPVTTLLEVLVNLETWDKLTALEQRSVEFACQVNLDLALQRVADARRERERLLEAKGVKVNFYPEEVLAVYRQGANTLLDAQLATAEPEFKSVAESLTRFAAETAGRER